MSSCSSVWLSLLNVVFGGSHHKELRPIERFGSSSMLFLFFFFSCFFFLFCFFCIYKFVFTFFSVFFFFFRKIGDFRKGQFRGWNGTRNSKGKKVSLVEHSWVWKWHIRSRYIWTTDERMNKWMMTIAVMYAILRSELNLRGNEQNGFFSKPFLLVMIVILTSQCAVQK